MGWTGSDPKFGLGRDEQQGEVIGGGEVIVVRRVMFDEEVRERGRRVG